MDDDVNVIVWISRYTCPENVLDLVRPGEGKPGQGAYGCMPYFPLEYGSAMTLFSKITS